MQTNKSRYFTITDSASRNHLITLFIYKSLTFEKGDGGEKIKRDVLYEGFIPYQSQDFRSYDTKGLFHQHFTSSFYTCRSQKRQKSSQVKHLFALSGSECLKAARKHVDEIDPKIPSWH